MTVEGPASGRGDTARPALDHHRPYPGPRPETSREGFQTLPHARHRQYDSDERVLLFVVVELDRHNGQPGETFRAGLLWSMEPIVSFSGAMSISRTGRSVLGEPLLAHGSKCRAIRPASRPDLHHENSGQREAQYGDDEHWCGPKPYVSTPASVDRHRSRLRCLCRCAHSDASRWPPQRWLSSRRPWVPGAQERSHPTTRTGIMKSLLS